MKNKEKKTSVKSLHAYLGRYYKFVQNELTGQLFYKRRDSKKTLKPFDRAFFSRILYERFDKYPTSMVREAIKSIYYTCFNEVKALFEVQKSPPKKNPFEELDNYITLADAPPFYFAKMLEMHFVRAIRCVLHGTPNRFIFTLVSRQQYVGKTHFIEWLFPPELQNYCMSTLSGRKEKRDTILAGKFIVNIDEFSGAKKSSDEQLKALVSQKSAAIWVPFKNCIEQRPRITSFFATKNFKGKAILSEEDDNSRYIIFNIDSIDWDYATDIDIKGLWDYATAQAHNPRYECSLTIEEVRELERYNKKFAKTKKKKGFFSHSNKKDYAIIALVGSGMVSLMYTPLGQMFIRFLTSLR